jgi:hypothetical protein
LRPYLLVAAAALAAFGLTLAGSFHFDDYALFNDPAITAPSGWYQVWRPLQTRPLTWFTFWVNFEGGGADPVRFHLVNLALHVLAVMLLLAVLRHLLPERTALLAALIFAVHPMSTEAVAYVFARGTLLSTILCLLSWWFWLKDRAWTAVVLFGAALLAKEECAAFPLLLWMWGRLPACGGLVARLRHTILLMIAMSLAAGMRVIWAASVIHGAGVGAGAGISPLQYLSVQGAVIVRYLAMLVIPWGYTIDAEMTAPIWWRIAAWLLIAAAIWAALRWRRAGFWFLSGLVLLAPSSSIFPAADLSADRRMYLPMIAFSACAALLIARLPKPALAAILVALCAISIRDSLVWRSERSLWSEAIKRAPDKVRPRIQLARALEPAAALDQLRVAEKIAPGDPAVASEKGRVFLELGRPAEALAAFGKALALSPNDANAVNNRGVALQALGQSEAARLDFERALKLNPCLFNARLNLRRLGGTPPSAPCRLTPDQAAQIQDR